MSDYRMAIEKVLRHEGGYVKDPLDHGGETYRGISRKYFPRWEGWSIVEVNHFDARLDEMVVQFYKKFFWDVIRLSEVNDQFIAEMLLNISVNIGKRALVKKVQRILGVNPDGIIGPITIGTINNADRDAFVYQFILEVIDLYTHIINKDKNQRRFIAGWLNRSMSLYRDYEKYKAL